MKSKKKDKLIKVEAKRESAGIIKNKTYFAVDCKHGIIRVRNDEDLWAYYHEKDFLRKGEDNNGTI